MLNRKSGCADGTDCDVAGGHSCTVDLDMDWQEASGTDSARPRATAWIAAALLVVLAAPVMAQPPAAPVVRQWRVADNAPRPASAAHVYTVPSGHSAVQDVYPEMPYAGEYLVGDELAGCDQPIACGPGCGCGRPTCCTPEALLLSPSQRGYWVSAEYLLWSIESSDLPPLVTTSPAGTAPEQTGILGRPGTRTLGGDFDDQTLSGFRVAGGWWLNAAQTAAFELSYAGLPRQNERESFSSLNHPLLARPVFDAVSGIEAAMLVAHPNLMSGDIDLSYATELHLAGALRRDRISQRSCRTVDTLIGFRFGSLEEALKIEQSSRFTTGQGQIIAGTTLDLLDRFETENRFYGLLVGLDVHERLGAWMFNARGTLSMGTNDAEVTIDGATVTSVPGDTTATSVGGLLAQQTNIGSYSRNRFAVLPELSLGLSTHLNRCWELNVGYHLLYWSEAARPGDQIDLRVSQFPPEPPAGNMYPSFELDTHGVFIHGLQTGLIYRF